MNIMENSSFGSMQWNGSLMQVRAWEGLELSFWTFILTVVLEVLSLDTVKKVMNQKGAGIQLYKQAIVANLRNHFIYGWAIYALSSSLFCRETQDLSAYERALAVATILFVHSLLFYAAHRSFHVYPKLYKHHRFHHRFNVHVPPMAANAVSSVEYIVAYILPFTPVMPLLRPDATSLRLAVAIVSLTNILIHTPKLGELSERLLPVWLVSTQDHLEHHRRLKTKYAAPTFNIDLLVAYLSSAILTQNGKQDGDGTKPTNKKMPQQILHA